MNNLSDFNCELASITDECRKYIKYGKAADYIPALAKADPRGGEKGDLGLRDVSFRPEYFHQQSRRKCRQLRRVP